MRRFLELNQTDEAITTGIRAQVSQDIPVAVVDGLKGFPDAINAAFPETTAQTCIVHLVRHSLNFCAWKDRKAVAARLRDVCSAETAGAARDALDAVDAERGGQYPSIAQAWRRAWDEVIAFLAFSPEIRRGICTTNAVESLNRIRRESRTPRCLPILLVPESDQDAGLLSVRGGDGEADLASHTRP